MVSDNGRFRVSSAMAEYIKVSELTPEAKKLLLALIHFQHLEAEGWPSVSFDDEGFFFHAHHDRLLDYARRVGDLRDLGFAPASRDTRFLAEPVASLLKNTGLFDLLELTRGRPRAIRWQFSLEAAWLMTDNDRYALMHKNDIRLCRSTLDASFLVQLSLHERMNFPEFSLLLCDRRHPEIEVSARPVSREELPSFRKRLKRLLANWSAIKSFGFVAELVSDRRMTSIVDVRIRVEHANTSWRFGQIEKIHPRNELMIVRPQSYGSPVAGK